MRALLLCLLPVHVALCGEQLLNLPLPDDGLRYRSLEALQSHWPAKHGEAHICLWKDDKFAPVSVTIDDNNAPNIPFWRELSEEHGWKFTWFVIVHPYMWDIYADKKGSNTGYFGTAELFKELHAEGHEVELHGACKTMNELPDEAYAQHIEASLEHLEGAIGHRITTFAYPCGKLGREDDADVFLEVVRRRMIAGRGAGGGATAPATANHLSSRSMGDGSGKMWWSKMEEPRPNLKYSHYRGWAVLVFHKVKNHEGVRELFRFIKKNEDRYWVAPFTQVARYAQQRESGTIKVDKVAPGEISFELSDRMHDEFFDYPLTVKLRTEGWEKVSATQAGKPVPARIVEHEGARFTLVDAVPDRGQVVVRSL